MKKREKNARKEPNEKRDKRKKSCKSTPEAPNAVLESIGRVYEQARESGLKPDFFRQNDNDLKLLSGYFSVTPDEAFLVAMVFALNYKGDTVDLKDLVEYCGCNPVTLLGFTGAFESLCSLGILKRQQSAHRPAVALSNDQFTVHTKITEAILKNNPMPSMEEEPYTDVLRVLERAYRLGKQRNEEEISTFDLFLRIEILLKQNNHFPLIGKILEQPFSIAETTLLVYLFWKTLSGSKSVEINLPLEGIFDDPCDRVALAQKLLAGTNILCRDAFVEIEEATFFNDASLKLSSRSVGLLRECGLTLTPGKVKRDNFIAPSDIREKSLFFNDAEIKQVDMLRALLREEAFRETQMRLSSKGMPRGITVLLHGRPGTGKTETVFQLARETGREIIRIDISQSKSMWFGESEKIIKRVFSDYREYAKDAPQMPVLLFNEADGILSRRSEHSRSNVAQTENAIQNILLEELERFDGIFMATTNLVHNLDTAFERRFLFKIEFSKPGLAVKSRIWQSRLPEISERDCEILAGGFDFSGGQIDNVIRKIEIREIIEGTTTDLSQILEFCRTETLGGDRGTHIGFLKS